jgi:CxxC motif-containing protein
MELICIKCPRGCLLNINNENITGNLCPRGIDYAKEEMSNPMRTVTTLIKTKYGIVPVKTSSEIPKNKIDELIKYVSKIYENKSYNIGDVIVENILNLNVDLVVTGEPYMN